MFGKILLIVLGVILVSIIILWLVGERWRLLRKSTLNWIREGGLRRFLTFSTLHGYTYIRWQNQYVNLFVNHIGPRSSTKARKWWSSIYHSKVLTQDQAEAIIKVNEPISLRDLEQIVPYPVAREFVLNAPPDMVVWDCGCRNARKEPCLPIQVCMVIGQPFVDFILEHHPNTSRKLNQEEALDLLRAEHKRGHIHAMWFKDAMMGRNYAICNCCKCCCGGIETMNRYGIPMLASSGYVSSIDSQLCTLCGICVIACPFDALVMDNKIVSTTWEKCLGCGVCTGLCPEGVIQLVRDERKGIPLDVRLMTHA
jgi:NAD-dependent dihydropyrimidine dehydrogenase PreA subunit